MNHTEADFLAKIIAEPDEDTPRLVFADWLEEHGQPERAEFIRVQCELSRWTICKVGRQPPLARREKELLEKFAAPWFCGPKGSPFTCLSPILSGHRKGCTGMCVCPIPKRGFVHAVEMEWGQWRTHADAILAAHPVQEVTLTTPPTEYHRSGIAFRATPLVMYESLSVDDLKKMWPRIKKWNLPLSDTRIDLREDQIVAQCSQCGTVTACRVCSDPYAEEIHNRVTEPAPWCDSCYQSACDDI